MGSEGGKKNAWQLTEPEWRVLHAARELDRRGIFASGDRLCEALPDMPGHAVRRARHELTAWGILSLSTPSMPKGDTAKKVRGSKPPGGRPARQTAEQARVFNIALYRIMDGKGSLCEALATITGLTANAIKCRVNTARTTYPTEELDPYHGQLSPHERSEMSSYIDKYLAHKDDPAVKAWAGNVISPRRARPDARSMTRDHERDTG